MPIKRIIFINLTLYGICGLVFILSDLNIYSGFSGASIHAVVPNIFYLIILAERGFLILKNYTRTLLLINISLAFLSFGLNLRGIQSTDSSVFQFFLLLSFLPYRSLSRKKKYKISDNHKLIEDEECTPIENVMKMLSGALDEFEEISVCINCENYAKKSYTAVESAVKILRNTPNIYRSNIEHITRNMNEQDKLFIEQSFSAQSIYSSMNDSDDVKENINAIYSVNDLSGVLKQIGCD